jgi:hypothetical protein
MTIGIQMNHAAPAYSPLSVFAIIRTPPKHGSLRLLQAVASDKLLPRRRASNVAAFGAANGDFSGLVEVGDGRFRCRLNG